MTATKQTKNELLNLIRESKKSQFEVIEPVTPDSLPALVPILRRELAQSAYLSVIIVRRS